MRQQNLIIFPSSIIIQCLYKTLKSDIFTIYPESTLLAIHPNKANFPCTSLPSCLSQNAKGYWLPIICYSFHSVKYGTLYLTTDNFFSY